ncbi:MAG: lysophospholipid acyltransferase family protein [Gammaproteobacteria bacterium]
MTATAFFLLKILGRLPLRTRRRLGACLGDLARLILRGRRRVAARNLSLALPEISAAERRAVLRRHFQLLGAVFLDECALLGMSASEVREWLHLDDEDASREGPVIFCAPHFVAAGIGGLRLSAPLGGRVMFHYRPLHSRFWDCFYRRLRGKFGAAGISAASAGAMRLCARNLRRGGAVFYLPDTDGGRRKSAVFAPFLGVAAAATTTAPSRLASLGGARVRLFTSFLTDDGYEIQMSPPLEDFPGADAAADTRRLNALIGEQIRRDPAQYYWLHRRFKTRPEGESPRYA